MSKRAWGIVAPLLVATAIAATVFLLKPRAAVANGIYAGLVLAVVQSFASTASLIWAWKKNYFYWVWGAGVFVRMIVFALTAFLVYTFTNLSFTATMTTMVSATTVFLVFESATLLKN